MTDETQTKPKHPGGRPPFFNTPEEMDVLIQAYFKECEDKDKPATVSGLAYALGFVNRKSVYEYSLKPEFTPTLSRAKLHIEKDTVEKGFSRSYNPNFVMFNLMNNFEGWESVKKQEVTHSGNISNETLTDEQLEAKIKRLTQQLDQ